MTDIAVAEDVPVFALVDDHIHSARLFTRTLRDAGALADIRWLGDARRALRALETLFGDTGEDTPDMVIVDLKSHSAANEEFVALIAPMARQAGVPVTVLVARPDAEKRRRLITAGASAVFERHHDRNAYQREIARLSSFWVLETGTWPIRA